MTRGPHDTLPMGLPPVRDQETTDPSPPPAPATSTVPGKNPKDPTLDPVLEAFNRPPRPPAPQPNQRSSSDGDAFAAHYAPPRELVAQKRPTPHDPDVLVELAALAGSESPRAEVASTPVIVQRDIETVVAVRQRRVTPKVLAIAGVVGALIAGPIALFAPRGPEKAVGVGTVSAGTAYVSALQSAAPALRDVRSKVVASSSPAPRSTLASTSPTPSSRASEPEASSTPPSAVRKAVPVAPRPVPKAAPAPRSAASEHVEPVPTRAAHEIPDTVL